MVKQAFINALGTAIYIIAVASFMFYGSQTKIGAHNTLIVPITVLLLFVSSAAITGSLIFGRPAMLYVDNKKKEALSLLFYTLVFLFILTVISIGFLISFS